jgi:hypothetical protein
VNGQVAGQTSRATPQSFDPGKVGEDGDWPVGHPVGQMPVQGAVTYGPGEGIKAEPYHFGITGGGGRYRGASGTVRIGEVSAAELCLTFRLRD